MSNFAPSPEMFLPPSLPANIGSSIDTSATAASRKLLPTFPWAQLWASALCSHLILGFPPSWNLSRGILIDFCVLSLAGV